MYIYIIFQRLPAIKVLIIFFYYKSWFRFDEDMNIAKNKKNEGKKITIYVYKDCSLDNTDLKCPEGMKL